MARGDGTYNGDWDFDGDTERLLALLEDMEEELGD